MNHLMYLVTAVLALFGVSMPVNQEPVLGGPSGAYQKTILPQTDLTYELGTSTLQWLKLFTGEICLAGDCKTAWPSGSGGGGAGGNGFYSATSSFRTPLIVTDGVTTSTLGAGYLNVATSTSNLSGLFSVDSSGNTSVSGTLQVYGALTLQNYTSCTSLSTNSSGGLTCETVASVYNEDFTTDGVTTTFYLSNAFTAGTERVYFNGVRQNQGVDYTMVGRLISFLYTPATGTLAVDYNSNVSNTVVANDAVRVLAEVASVDLTSASVTSLYTVPNGKTLYITATEIEITANNTVSADGTFRIGGNDPDYNDWAEATFGNTVPVLTGKRYHFTVPAVAAVYSAGTVIKMLPNPATAVSFVGTIRLIGYLR